VFDYAAFFEVLAAGSAVFFALSFAANSCLTMAAMASVSTLYVLAASRSTVVGFDREAAKALFRYMLEGHNADWQEPGTRRQAFYNDLHPGRYRFRVIACNSDGVWNAVSATLNFSVALA
jgi:hypothetical protein